MNTQNLSIMNAAAIDRFNLVEQARSAQASLGESVAARFEKFARSQGGAIYEHGSIQAIERAFARFEWAEVDRIYTAMFSRLAGGAAGSKSANSPSSEVRMIVVDKLRRLVKKPAGPIARLIGKVAGVTFLALLFMFLSTFVGEAVLHFTHR